MFNIFRKNKIIIWIVDDKVENQIMISKSFYLVNSHIIIENIHNCDQYFKRIDECKNSDRPHIIFMDYFMGEYYGTELVEYLNDKRHLIGHPIIVGHSSNVDCSKEIVKVGGDFVMEKIKGLEYSAAITHHFKTVDDLIYIINKRSLPHK